LETASVPAGERGERGGQRGRTTDGTGTNDRRAKRATRRHRTRRRRRPMRPTSRPRRRTQARLERSGKPRPRGTVAHEYAPSRNPFLKRRGRVLRYLMRPVPVVRRPMAFVDQLSVSAAEGGRVSRRDFSRTRQIRGFAWPEGGVGIATRTVPLAGRGVAARAARGLLDVEGATTTPAMSRGRRARSRQSIASKTLTLCIALGRLPATRPPGSFGDVPPAQRVALVPPLAEAPGTFADLTHGLSAVRRKKGCGRVARWLLDGWRQTSL